MAKTVLLLTLVAVGCTTGGADGPAPLGITVAKGPLGLTLTSREVDTITRCDASFSDGHTQWSAEHPDPLEQSQSADIPWSDFRSPNDQILAGHLGYQATQIEVSCWIERLQERRNALTRF